MSPPDTESTLPAITADASLASLATSWAGASRVFLRHGLDFCCHGQQTVAAACTKKGLDVEQVLGELRTELLPAGPAERWDDLPLSHLLVHILDHYHAGHRAELPRLLQMAERVEAVHAAKADCPRGLAAHLRHVAHELEQHMQKEEQVLFPMFLAGNGTRASDPISVIEAEHEEHGRNLERLRQLAHDFVPPAQACGTWRALYLGLQELERDVMQHIHLENHVLFPRAMRG